MSTYEQTRRKSTLLKKNIFQTELSDCATPVSFTGSDTMDTLEVAGPSKPPPDDARAVNYEKSLRREKDKWEEFYKRSKWKSKKLLRQKETEAGTDGVPMSRQETLDALSEEDRRFLAERPDYEGFGRLLESVWKRRLCVLELKDEVDHSYRIIGERCEAFREKLVADVLRDNE